MDPLLRYLQPVPRPARLWWLVAALLVAGSIWGGVEVQRRYERLQRQQIALARLQRATRVLPPPTSSRADLEAARHWDVLRRTLEFSWYPIFAALEHTDNPDIALLEFLPEKSSGTLTLRGNARDMNALADYLDALMREPVFVNVYLAHQKKAQQGTLPVVQFEIRLKMR